MKAETRRRAEILGELENIPFAVQGKICENRKILADGTIAVYHNLQWRQARWKAGVRRFSAHG